MTKYSTPPLPIPPPLRGIETGTFTRYSIEVRLVEIALRTLNDNVLPPENIAALQALAAEIPYAPIRPIRNGAAPDGDKWAGYTSTHLGRSWLEVPWFFAEAYFYRRILEATGYFETGPGQNLDPFLREKNNGYLHASKQIHALCSLLNRALKLYGSWQVKPLAAFIQTSLWGNQADLSLWPSGTGEQPNHPNLEQAREFLLVDDVQELIAYLSKLDGRQTRIDFLCDNVGFELVTDLCLADYLLTTGMAASVNFHLKPHPTFVSDTMASDVAETIAHLGQEPEPDTNSLADRLVIHLEKGRLNLLENDFWTSPLLSWEMPQDLREDLKGSALVIAKGDMHYRRCLGDRHWPFTTPFEDIMRHYPAPLVCLRTLKSEIVCGLAEQQPEEISRRDPEWLYNGRWGLIQFAWNR